MCVCVCVCVTPPAHFNSRREEMAKKKMRMVSRVSVLFRETHARPKRARDGHRRFEWISRSANARLLRRARLRDGSFARRIRDFFLFLSLSILGPRRRRRELSHSASFYRPSLSHYCFNAHPLPHPLSFATPKQTILTQQQQQDETRKN